METTSDGTGDWRDRWSPDDLPRPTDDPARARQDIDIFGYCLLRDTVPEPLLTAVRARLAEQTAAEKRLGLAFEDGGPRQQWGQFRDAAGELRADAFTAAMAASTSGFGCWSTRRAVPRGAGLDADAGPGRPCSGRRISAVQLHRRQRCRWPLHTDQWWALEPTRRGRRPLPVGSMTCAAASTMTRRLAGAAADLAPAAVFNVLVMLNGMTAERRHPGGAGQPFPAATPTRRATAMSPRSPPRAAWLRDHHRRPAVAWHRRQYRRQRPGGVDPDLCGPQHRPQEITRSAPGRSCLTIYRRAPVPCWVAPWYRAEPATQRSTSSTHGRRRSANTRRERRSGPGGPNAA